ncbi:holliday junction ATP-dependent DNA helicase RuvB [Oxobacter pfennigii]|uniref:Holliday junction ATP-dependent DNA helicase RuvB n=1 Tax=Oxobacter pfennigii TaxID=36849 RepID=A0A0P8YRX5_9CLOT|nr:MoxR family ATPase [Oxobacter pfennigii]KPU42369.1 holliday junction ATP-dependent DNA helicase RuvB [Oxobacter pfennigii]
MQKLIDDLARCIEKAILGKAEVIYDILKCLIAGGHVLIEDVPGVGKTTLVKALAKTLSLNYNRIQFTPDLLPSDITGVSIYNRNSDRFEFIKGPIFSNIILADEINRASPKTQSALLEVMEESQVTEGNNTYSMDMPFMVLATQNPVEHEGTYMLPAAQLDRFMMKVKIGYADEESESRILQLYGSHDPLEGIWPRAGAEDIIYLQKSSREVFASKEITDYIIRIVNATRENKNTALGASTRAALSMLKVAKAAALMEGRDYVVPQDVWDNGVSVLSHRVSLKPSAIVENLTGETIIQDILKRLPVPRVMKHA